MGNNFFYVGYERREIFQNSIPYDIKVDGKVTVNQTVAQFDHLLSRDMVVVFAKICRDTTCCFPNYLQEVDK
jgi:hypothetical protein